MPWNTAAPTRATITWFWVQNNGWGTLNSHYVCVRHSLFLVIIIIIIIIKRISRAPIYYTRWEHRALYNNTNDRHTHTDKQTDRQTDTHTHTLTRRRRG